MKNYIRIIYDKLKRNEKEMLIRASGSTAEGSNEKIRSGQSYLYKTYGMESEVIEVRFKRKVTGSFLSSALMSTAKRYPYFNTKLIEKDGDFYIVQNEQPMIVKRTRTLAKLGHVSCGYHLLDITYYGHSVFISFHHALCDGRGVMPFIETLLYYYCKEKYRSKACPDGIRLEGDKLLEGETVDPFMKRYDYNENKEFISLSRDAYDIPENVPVEETTNYRYEVKISSADYMRACKANNATPVILLSLLMSRGISKLYPEYDKPINANIATDMREALDCPNTFKNCVKSMILPYSREFSALSLKEQATEYREVLKAQRDRDYCRREANNLLGLFDRLDALKSYEEKQKIMSFFDGMALKTYVISYLGKFNLGDNARYVEEIHLYNSGTTGLGINMISVRDWFVLDFKQNFSSDKYVKAFLKELDELSIYYEASERIDFITPEDSVIKRKKRKSC